MRYCFCPIKEEIIHIERIIVDKKKIGEHRRNQVFARDHNRCVKCGSSKDLTIDHITPFSLGGNTSMNNLQTLCGDCNKEKRNTKIRYAKYALKTETRF